MVSMFTLLCHETRITSLERCACSIRAHEYGLWAVLIIKRETVFVITIATDWCDFICAGHYTRLISNRINLPLSLSKCTFVNKFKIPINTHIIIIHGIPRITRKQEFNFIHFCLTKDGDYFRLERMKWVYKKKNYIKL